MSFLPLKAKDLKVGLYIRIDHNWSEHPFLRNAFKIKSVREIAMIKHVGSGNEEGLRAADAIIESVINILNGGAAETSLINEISEKDSSSISFIHALNVCILSMTVGQELDLGRRDAYAGARDTDFSIQESLLPGKVSRETLKYLNLRNMSGYFMSESAA